MVFALEGHTHTGEASISLTGWGSCVAVGAADAVHHTEVEMPPPSLRAVFAEICIDG